MFTSISRFRKEQKHWEILPSLFKKATANQVENTQQNNWPKFLQIVMDWKDRETEKWLQLRDHNRTKQLNSIREPRLNPEMEKQTY
jgi:hypothetical protein